MSEYEATTQEVQPPKKWWHRLESGQAMVEYWPTLPAAIMVMIVAGALVGPMGRIFRQTADALNLETCGTAPPAYFTMPIGQVVDVIKNGFQFLRNLLRFFH